MGGSAGSAQEDPRRVARSLRGGRRCGRLCGFHAWRRHLVCAAALNRDSGLCGCRALLCLLRGPLLLQTRALGDSLLTELLVALALRIGIGPLLLRLLTLRSQAPGFIILALGGLVDQFHLAPTLGQFPGLGFLSLARYGFGLLRLDAGDGVVQPGQRIGQRAFIRGFLCIPGRSLLRSFGLELGFCQRFFFQSLGFLRRGNAL